MWLWTNESAELTESYAGGGYWCWMTLTQCLVRAQGEVHHGELLVHHFILLHAYKIMHKTPRIFICDGTEQPIKLLKKKKKAVMKVKENMKSVRSSTEDGGRGFDSVSSWCYCPWVCIYR